MIQVPQHLLRHFLRGYVDGDGCLCFTEKHKYLALLQQKHFLMEC